MVVNHRASSSPDSPSVKFKCNPSYIWVVRDTVRLNVFCVFFFTALKFTEVPQYHRGYPLKKVSVHLLFDSAR